MTKFIAKRQKTALCLTPVTRHLPPTHIPPRHLPPRHIPPATFTPQITPCDIYPQTITPVTITPCDRNPLRQLPPEYYIYIFILILILIQCFQFYVYLKNFTSFLGHLTIFRSKLCCVQSVVKKDFAPFSCFLVV